MDIARWLIGLVTAALAAGCVAASPPRPVAVGHSAVEAHPFQDVALGAPPPVVAPPPPPAVSNAVAHTLPAPAGQVWVDGHYTFANNGYRWEPGHWQPPPRPDAHWQQPSWHDGRWFPGFWTPQPTPPPDYVQQGPWNPGWTGAGQQLGVPMLQAVPAAVPTAPTGAVGAQTVVVP